MKSMFEVLKARERDKKMVLNEMFRVGPGVTINPLHDGTGLHISKKGGSIAIQLEVDQLEWLYTQLGELLGKS